MGYDVCSDPPNTTVVPWPHHERGIPPYDDAARSGGWVRF